MNSTLGSVVPLAMFLLLSLNPQWHFSHLGQHIQFLGCLINLPTEGPDICLLSEYGNEEPDVLRGPRSQQLSIRRRGDEHPLAWTMC